MPIAQHSFLVTKPEDIPATVAAAYQIATTGRPGPVLIDVDQGLPARIGTVQSGPDKVGLPGYKARCRKHTASRSRPRRK